MENTCEAPNIWNDDFYQSAALAMTYKKNDPLEFGSMTLLTLIFVILNILNHILLLLMLGGISYVCIQMRFRKTAMHAFLCTLGMIFLLAEGMMVRYRTNPFTHNVHPLTQNRIHIGLQVTGGLLGIIGTGHKMLMKKKHFHTTHGKFGLASLILWTVNLILGTLAYFVKDFGASFGMLLSTLLHSFIGIITFFMSVFAQYCGYESGFFRRNFSNVTTYKNFLIIMMVLTALGPIEICVDNYIQYISSE